MQKLESRNLQLYYGDFHALKGISMGMKKNTVTALIGPSGCGKSTYLRLFNRMNDLIDTYKDSIKDNLIYNISKNNYEAVSTILMNNKDKIVSSITEYTKEILVTNKNNISNTISTELENANINDLLTQNEFADKLSQYIINSKDYFNEQASNYLLKISSSDATIASILP